MDQEKEEQTLHEDTPQGSAEETPGQSSYSFIKETIKKRPQNRRSIVLRAVGIAAAAVGFGVIAAFVFAVMRPVAERVVSGPEKDPRVSIPADEEPETASAAGSEVSASSSSAEKETPAPEKEPEETAAPTPTPAVTPEPESPEPPAPDMLPVIPESGITLEQYRQLHLDMIDAASDAERAMVSVVGVSNELDYFLQDHENRKQAAGLVVAKNDTDVFILSDSAAVTDVEEILVTFSDGTSAAGTVIRGDENTGLTAIRTPVDALTPELASELSEISLGNSFTVVRGEPVLVLGSPDGLTDAVAYGMVTSVSERLSATDTEYYLLSTDIDGGSSSGALVNLKGEVVGFITQKLAQQDGSSISALSISRIKTLIEHLLNNDALPYAGIHGQTVTPELSEITGIPVGLLVTEVDPDSPAMLAGIKEFDVITGYAGISVESMDSFSSALSAQVPGQNIQVTAQRRGADGYAEISFEMAIEQR